MDSNRKNNKEYNKIKKHNRAVIVLLIIVVAIIFFIIAFSISIIEIKKKGLLIFLVIIF